MSTPLARVPAPGITGFDIAAPGANTNILAASLTPKHAGWFCGSVVLATGSVFNYTVNDGTNTRTVGLDDSTSINAGDLFPFAFPVSPDFSYNFQVETDGIIRQLVVLETSTPPGLPASLGTVTVSIGSGATDLGKAEDAVHASGDVGVSMLAVRKDTAAGLAADGDYHVLEVDASGRLYIAPAPANSGVDIGDVDILSVIPGVGATNLGKAADGVAGATDTGIAPLAIRDDALSAITPAEGDWAPFRVDVNGAHWVSVSAALPAGTNNIGDVDILSVIPGTGATNLGKAVDDVPGATDTGIAALVVRDDSLTTLTPADGDYTHLRVNSSGSLHTTVNGQVSVSTISGSVVPGTAATNLGKAIDSAAGATDTGVATLAIRDDALSALTPVEGDWAPNRVDGFGALWTQGAIGGAAYVGGAGAVAAGVQRTTLASDDPAVTALQIIDDWDSTDHAKVVGAGTRGQVTPTVTAGAYSAGDVIGGSLSFSIPRVSGRGVYLTHVQVVDDAGVLDSAACELWLFDRALAVAVADNAAWSTVAEAELHNCLGVVDIAAGTGTWKSAGTPNVATLKDLGLRLDPATTVIVAYLVTRGTPTLAATDDITVSLSVAQD